VREADVAKKNGNDVCYVAVEAQTIYLVYGFSVLEGIRGSSAH